MNEMPENLSDEEKEAWEKSLTAGSLPTWWKPNPADPAAQPGRRLHLKPFHKGGISP